MNNKQFATAVHIMMALSLEKKGQLISSKELALSVNTNPVVIRRILQSLQKSGLIETVKGQSGGVRLKKAPQQINLKHVFLAVQKRQLITPAKRKVKKNCAISRCMQGVMCSVASGVDQVTTDYLEGITLEELKKKIN